MAVHYFGVSFCTVSPSVCLDDKIWILVVEWPFFVKELLFRLTICSLYHVALVLFHFGFEDKTLVQIVSVPSNYLPFIFLR